MAGVLVTMIIMAIMAYFYLKKAGAPGSAGPQDDPAQLRKEAISNPQSAFDRTKKAIQLHERKEVDSVNEVLE